MQKHIIRVHFINLIILPISGDIVPSLFTSIPKVDCTENERYCQADHKCIPESYWCDAYYKGPDCSDGEGEKLCSGENKVYQYNLGLNLHF